MADPTVTGGVIGGVIVATCWGISKVIPAVAKVVRSNGKYSSKNNTVKSIECKPGKAEVCIERGEKLATHDQILINLVNETEESKEDRKDIKKEIKFGLQRVYDKLDGK